MSFRRSMLIMLVLSMFVMGAWGALPDKVTVSSNREWVVAGNSTPATITVTVTNNTYIFIAGVNVTLTCLDDKMGMVSPSSKLTSSNGDAIFTFTPKTVSGNATLKIDVSYHNSTEGNYSNTFYFVQKIDHNIPREFDNIIFNGTAPVDSSINITVRLKDIYGNIVDSKNNGSTISENVTFITASGWFDQNGILVNKVTVQVDRDGNATAKFKLPTIAGYYPIQIIAGETVLWNKTWITVKGAPLKPDCLNTSGSINPAQVKADGIENVTILLTLKDKYGNPVPNYDFYWWTNIGEERKLKTNDFGQVYLIYGPKTAVIDVMHYAGLEKGSPCWSSVSTFYSPGPSNFILTATNQTLPSLDADNTSFSMISVQLVDIYGNSNRTANEMVKFKIFDYFNDSPLDAPPYLNSTGETEYTNSTNDNGVAMVKFIPPKFNNTVQFGSGGALVHASWGGTTKAILIEFKNYPHLKIELGVPKECISPGNTTTIGIRVNGDGWDMRKPVDILLLQDRAETMLYGSTFGKYTSEYDKDRMWAAVKASMIFLNCMTADPPSSGSDRIAIASYGDLVTPADLFADAQQQLKWVGDDNSDKDDMDYLNSSKTPWHYRGNRLENYTFFNKHLELTDLNNLILNDIENKILENITPYNDLNRHDDPKKPEKQNAAPIRLGLYESIVYLNETGTSTNKAIVGLMDTSWTWYGDPLARKSGSTMGDPWQEASAGTSKWFAFDGQPTSDYTWKNSSNWPKHHGTKTYGTSTIQWNTANGMNNWQNMSNFAKAHGISLWMVFYNGQYDENTYRDLKTLCNATGGKAYYAATPEQLNEAFRQIAYELQRLYAVNTSTKIDFSTLSINRSGIEISASGREVFDYIYDNISQNKSTYIQKIAKDDTYQKVVNQTREWEQGYLNFTIGNLSRNDWWSAQFTLKANQSGLVHLFSNRTIFTYYDEKGKPYTVTMPDEYICIAPEAGENARYNILEILNPDSSYNNATEMVEVRWHLNYSGNNVVRQNLYYEYYPSPSVNCTAKTPPPIWHDPEPMTLFAINITGGKPIPPSVMFAANKYARDMTGWVRIRIQAYEEPFGGPSDQEILEPVCIPPRRGEIKIE